MPKAKLTELHNEIDKMLSEGMALWEKYLKAPIPEEYRYFGADEVAENYDGRHIIDLAAACQCFFYFRYLHSDMESESDIRTLTRAQEEERWLETRAQIAAQQAEQERAQAEKARIDRLAEEIGFDLDQFKADAQKIAEALPGVNAAKIANAETAYDAFVAFETFYAQAKIGAKYNEAGKTQCRKNAAQMKRAYNALKAVNEEFQTAAN